jgi:hypothetical protein
LPDAPVSDRYGGPVPCLTRTVLEDAGGAHKYSIGFWERVRILAIAFSGRISSSDLSDDDLEVMT